MKKKRKAEKGKREGLTNANGAPSPSSEVQKFEPVH